MLTRSVNSEITKVIGVMIPCQRPSQNPASPAGAAAATFGPAAHAASSSAIRRNRTARRPGERNIGAPPEDSEDRGDPRLPGPKVPSAEAPRSWHRTPSRDGMGSSFVRAGAAERSIWVVARGVRRDRPLSVTERGERHDPGGAARRTGGGGARDPAGRGGAGSALAADRAVAHRGERLPRRVRPVVGP